MKITGLDVGQEKIPLYNPDGADASREAFEQKKRELKEKFVKNPLCFTDILVNEKLDSWFWWILLFIVGFLIFMGLQW